MVDISKINKRVLTGMLHQKNWQVKEFLKYINRSQDAYHRGAHGKEHERLRLYLMIQGLPHREEE